jgi:large subunit ribosomal protein L23
MALFSRKTKKDDVKDVAKVEKKAKAPKATKEKKVVKAVKADAPVEVTTSADLSGIIVKPRITEKAAIKADEANSYCFDVAPHATKTLVAQAIKAVYKVAPVKVNIINTSRKPSHNKVRRIWVGGGKKAMVFLKKGDKIEFV